MDNDQQFGTSKSDQDTLLPIWKKLQVSPAKHSFQHVLCCTPNLLPPHNSQLPFPTWNCGGLPKAHSHNDMYYPQCTWIQGSEACDSTQPLDLFCWEDQGKLAKLEINDLYSSSNFMPLHAGIFHAHISCLGHG